MKKVFSLILAVVLCLSLCACGEKTTASAEQTIPVVETEVPTEPATVIVETIPVVETEAPTEPAPVIEVVDVPLGSMLSTDFVEMSFKEAIVAKDVKYSVKTGVVTRITGPEPVSGQQYICLTGTIKNTSTSALPVYDFFIGEFNLDGYTYKVDANDCDILDGEGQTEYEIAPLMEYTYRLYVAIPDALADSHSTCTFTFGFYDGFDNQEMAYNRAFEENPIALCPYQFNVTIK